MIKFRASDIEYDADSATIIGLQDASELHTRRGENCLSFQESTRSNRLVRERHGPLNFRLVRYYWTLASSIVFLGYYEPVNEIDDHVVEQSHGQIK